MRLWKVPVVTRERIVGLRVEGWSYSQIQAEVGVSAGTVATVLRLAGCRGGVERREVPGRLTLQDRVEIQRGLDAGKSYAWIGRQLGWHPSTISREVARHGGRHNYLPFMAHRAACRAARRFQPTKLGSNPVLLTIVTGWLQQLWSPQQIARRLRQEFPNRPEMWVSHETIYQSLFVQGRGELRRELARCLRSGRARRRPRDTAANGQGRIAGMVNISERPAEGACQVLCVSGRDRGGHRWVWIRSG